MTWKSSGEPCFDEDLKPDAREHYGERRTVLDSLHMSTKLFVGNLDFKITENDLQDAFAAHGNVIEANLVTDRTTGRPRGFAFVTMGSPEEAQKAIDALNGKDLGGRTLNVNIARPREERSGGGGGRSGYGGGGRDRY
jgi:cold-inducible RNA-binding protein